MNKQEFLDFYQAQSFKVHKLCGILQDVFNRRETPHSVLVTADDFHRHYNYTHIGFNLSIYNSFVSRFFTLHFAELNEIPAKELLTLDMEQSKKARESGIGDPREFLTLINQASREFQELVHKHCPEYSTAQSVFLMSALSKVFESSNLFDLLYRDICGGLRAEIEKEAESACS